MIFLPINALLVQQQAQRLFLYSIGVTRPFVLQQSHAANRSIIVGNLGAVREGAQTASPLNVR